MPTRIRCVYTGRVQGVGFRYTTAGLAAGHAVTGYVRNRPDGLVELVAEGEAAEVESFLSAVAERMRGNIDAADRCASAATGEFTAFAVRH